MKKKMLLAILLLLVGVNGVVGLSYYIHGDNGLEGNYLKLIPPPPEALASNYGNPLLTTDIGLFAYYEASSWDLNDVIPAFHNYTQYTNYIDGYVRVWSDANGTTFTGDEPHDPPDQTVRIDVSVRVRSDGWILAWIEDTQEKGLICIWGDDVLADSDFNKFFPVDTYNTCLSRAMHRVFHNAGVSWVGYDEIYYYDYQYPDATRLNIFGDQVDTGFAATEEHYYFVVPDTVTIEEIYLCGAGWSSDTPNRGVRLDDVMKIAMAVGEGAGTGWKSVDISSSISVGTRYDVKLDCYGNEAHVSSYVLLWSS